MKGKLLTATEKAPGVVLLSAALLVALAIAPSAAPADDDGAIVHVLNRIGFGPKAGDVEKVRAIGLRTYIERQLHPDRIPDADMSERLNGLRTLGMKARDIATQYELPLLRARREQRQRADTQGKPQAGTQANGDKIGRAHV